MYQILIEDHILMDHNNNDKMNNLTMMKLLKLIQQVVEKIMFVTMIHQYLQQVQLELLEKHLQMLQLINNRLLQGDFPWLIKDENQFVYVTNSTN